MRRMPSLLCATALLLAGASGAQDIRISQSELDNLGIRFVTPERATEVAAIEATARVVIPPDGDAVVGTPQAGLLTHLNVAPGDQVARGDVLAQISSSGFLTLQREFLDALNTQRLAHSELRRDEQLNAEGIISTRRLQETATRSRIAQAGLTEHRQLLGIAGLSEDDVQALQSDQKMLPSLLLRAPFDGVIIERMASTGERLDGMSPVYRVADLSELWLEIDVPQERIATVRPGMTVSGAGYAFKAQVTTINRAIDAVTQTIKVRARLTAGTQQVNPGQFVAVRLMTDGAPMWTVPAAAVTRSGTGHYLFARSTDGVQVREVHVVNVSDGRAYLATPVESGARVAVSGISALKSMWSAMSDAQTE